MKVSRRNKGLTLVEMILVIVVLGIIAGVIYSKVLNKGVGTAKASASAAALENIIDGVNQYFATNMCTDTDSLDTNNTNTSCFSSNNVLNDLCSTGFLKCEQNGSNYAYKLPMGKTITIESDPNYGIIVTVPDSAATTDVEKEQMKIFCKAALKTWGNMKFIKLCKTSGGAEIQSGDCNSITQMKVVIMPATIAADPVCPQ